MKTDVNTPKTRNKVAEGHANCTQCPIRSQTLFADLPDNALDHIRNAIDNVSYPAHATLLKAGAKDNALYSIRQGKIKLVRQLPNGTLRTVRLLRQGDTLGLEAMQNLPSRHSAIALTEVKICRIPMTVILTLKQQHPQLDSS
jgi:cAMP-binding proteins - catabolite gene activator and regulatory subunit of cAMP-dependent protein kinases